MRDNYAFHIIFILLFILFSSNQLFSQTTVTVANGSAEGPIPIYPYYNYGYGEIIYTQSQIANQGVIDQIQFEWDGGAAETRSWKIYMGHTSKTTYSSTTDWITTSGLTEVYDGTVSLNSSGSAYFLTINLENNFTYNNSNNLVVAIQDNTADYIPSGSAYRFHSASTGDSSVRSIVKYNDAGAVSSTSPPTASNRYTYTPSFKIRITSASPSISVGSAVSGLNYASGSGPSSSQTTTVSGSNLSANITVAAPTNFEVSTDNSSFSDSVALTQSGGTVNSTTIHTRLKTGLSTGSYSGNITASSTNATNQTISLSGNVGVSNLYVDDSGSNSNNGLTSGAPFATLAYAISQAIDGIGATINVAAGTYTEHTVNVNKSVTIKGAGSSSTIFDSNTSNVGFISITSSDVTIEALKIKDYNFTSSSTTANAYGGAGIRVGVTPGNETVSATLSGITIKDVVFEDNYSDASSGDGGAIEFQTHASPYSTSTTATIEGCTFKGNRAGITGSNVGGHNGGAIQGKIGAHVTIKNSIFYDNDADYTGSAVNFWATASTATVTMNNCTLYDNTAFSSASGYIAQFMAVGNVTANINNSIIYGASIGNANSFDVDGQDVLDNYTTTINMRNSIIGDYSTTEYDHTASSVTEGQAPLFADTGSDDYTLQDSSPAIDTASSTYAPVDDFNDLSRPQGQADDMGAYEHRNTWDGSTDTDWSTTANWSENIVPVSGRSPIIADVTNQPVISSDDGSSGDVTLEDITINSGAELTINKEASLTLTDDFTNNSGSVYLESDSNEFASIIVQGDASGNITYKRYVNAVTANGWDLIGSPVDGLDINTFVSTNTSGTATLATNGVQVAIGTYSNSNNDWSNYTTDGSGAGNVNAAGNFDIGKGYQMGTVDGGTNILQFTGTIATADQLQAVINNHGNGSGRRWNLVANPFPSYLMLNDDAHGSNNLLTVNNSIIDGSYLAAYGYDADGSGFTAYGQDYLSNTAKYVAPGQSFMIAASSSSSANLSITEAMLTTTGSDDFISGDQMNDTEIYLKLFNEDQMIETTHIKFQENMTLGLDPGYDLGNYYQGAAISTRLVEDDEGNNFEHQQLPPSAMENAVIPLVINQSAGQEFRVNLYTATIPDPNVYLEDVEEGTFTNLYEGDFVLTPTSDLEGVGRFFIHMSADTMSNEDVSTSLLNAYKEVDASYITIEGLATQTNETKVSLYNILGREVFSTTLNNNMNTQTISTVGLSSGIYVIELESGSDRLTKKLLIQ